MTRLFAFLALLVLAAPAVAQDFPVTIRHAFGETVIAAPPQRVVSVGYHEQDFLYALGVAPVGVHEWFGGRPYATWPWAEAARQAVAATPEVQNGYEIDLEWVLSLEPDLIVATFAPMDARSYAQLAQIAPVVGPPTGYPTWGAPWEEELRLIGQATGQGARAETVIADVVAQVAGLRQTYPQLAGLRGTMAYFTDGQFIGYRSSDGANRLLMQLGVTTPATFDQMTGSGGNFSISPERADLFDLDVVLWLVEPPSRKVIEALPTYAALRLAREGRSVWADELMMGAMSFQSPLSQAWALESLGAALAAAADGDPATVVPLEGVAR